MFRALLYAKASLRRRPWRPGYCSRGWQGLFIFSFVQKNPLTINVIAYFARYNINPLNTIVPMAGRTHVGIFRSDSFSSAVLAVYFLLNLDEWIKLPAVYRHYKQYKWVQNLTINQQ